MLGIPSNLYGTGYGAGFSASRAESTLGAAMTAPLGAGRPVNTVAGVLSGLTAIGSTLTATLGTWASTTATTYTIQYQADGVNLGSPTTSRTYVVQAADGSKVIKYYVIATNAAGSSNGALSNGITIDAAGPLAGYFAWYDIGTLVGYSNGDPVNLVPDLSANAKDISSDGASRRPLYRPSALNGRPGVEFDGVNDFLENNLGTYLTAGGVTIFMVMANVAAPAVASYAMIFDTTASVVTPDSRHYCHSYTNAGQAAIHCGIGAGAVCQVNTTDGESFLLAMKYNGASSLLRLNGDALRQDTTAINTGDVSGVPFRFALEVTSSLHPAAYILLEAVVYNSALGSTDFASVEAYLKTKYGL